MLSIAGHTDGMTHRVGPKGQVVIPKSMRDRLGLAPGTAVAFELDGDTVRVAPVRDLPSLGGSIRGHDLTALLEQDRRAEPR